MASFGQDAEKGRHYMHSQVIGTGHSRSFELESFSYIQHKDFALQILQKKGATSTHRSKIPATKMDILTYLRSYVSTLTKHQIVCMAQLSKTKFLLFYVLNTIFKSVPITYIQIFLSSYVPDEHFYVTKMSPLFYGYIWCVIVTTMNELSLAMDGIVLLADWATRGFMLGLNYDTCSVYKHISAISGKLQYCVNIQDYKKIVAQPESFPINGGRHFSYKNNTYVFSVLYELWNRERHLSYSPHLKCNYYYIGIMVAAWMLPAIFYNMIFKKRIWKFLKIFHIMLMAYLLPVWLHVTLFGPPNDSATTFKDSNYSSTIMDFIASTIVSDTSQILASNGVLYIIKGFTIYGMSKYIDQYMGTNILYKYYSLPWMYAWAIYCHDWVWKDLLLQLFYIINTGLELVTFVITFHCLLEATVREWPKVPKWALSLIMAVVGFFMTYFMTWEVKVYTVYSSLRGLHDATHVHDSIRSNDWFCVSVIPVLIFVGLITAIIKYMVFNKQSWRSLLRPASTWGPRDHICRQLRKQYDSRVFVLSGTSRYLSRYIMDRAAPKFYRLDVLYDKTSRRSTYVPHDNYHVDTEKKMK